MKKLTAGLTALILMAMPIGNSLAQDATQDQKFLEGLGGLTLLEDYEATEAIFGSFNSEDEGLTMMYRMVFNETNNDAGNTKQKASSEFKGYLEMNYDEKGEWDPFKNLKANVQGEIRMIGVDDLYLKLDAINIATEEAEDDVEEDLKTFRLIAAGMTDQWIHISLKDIQNLNMGRSGLLIGANGVLTGTNGGVETENIGDVEALNALKGDAEGMIRYLVESIAAEQMTQFMYFESHYGNSDYIDVYDDEEDYQATIKDNDLKVHPVDVELWIEKDALKCETQAEQDEKAAEIEMMENELEGRLYRDGFGMPTTYDSQNIDEGFNHLACWTNESSNLNEEEMEVFYEIDYGTGKWLFEAENDWSYVVTRDASEEPYFKDNYLNYLEDAVEVEIEAWKEQGVLMCEDQIEEFEMIEDVVMEMDQEIVIDEEPVMLSDDSKIDMTPPYLSDDVKNGFEYAGCWHNYDHEGELTKDQKKFVDGQIGGEWIHIDGKWFFASGVHEMYDDEGELEAMQNFEPDPERLNEMLEPVRKGLDLFFEADLFSEMDVISGPNEGFKFFRLKDNKVIELVKAISKNAGFELSEYELNEMKEILDMFSVAGIYNVSEEGIMDNLFTRFKVNFPHEEGHFEMNYRFKLGSTKNVSTVQTPNDAMEITQDMLMEGLMNL